MEMNFSIGKDISLDFSIGGGAPAPPAPAPVSVYSDIAVVFTNVLTGSVATYEEVNNGN